METKRNQSNASHGSKAGPAQSLQVDIPCKWMLAGEYSALTPRGLALAAAVRPGFCLRVHPCEGRTFQPEGFGPPSPAGGRTGTTPADFAKEAWAATARWCSRKATNRPQHGYRATFSRQLPEIPGPRPGSSAAIVVGMVFALDRLWNLGLSVDERLAAAREAHVLVQGGGSGYDVNTLGLGGVVLSPAAGTSRPESRPGLPGIWLVCAQASAKVPTTSHLARFDKASSKPEFRRALSRHVRASNALVRTLWEAAGTADRLNPSRPCSGDKPPSISRTGEAELPSPGPDFALLARRIEAAERTLRKLSNVGRLGVFTPEVRSMLALSRRAGIPARVSGGGGGDAVVAFAPGKEPAERLSSAFSACGWPATVLAPDSACEGPETLLI